MPAYCHQCGTPLAQNSSFCGQCGVLVSDMTSPYPNAAQSRPRDAEGWRAPSAAGGIGCGLSVLAAFFALIGTVPLLGWTNWFTTLPLALSALVLSALALGTGRGSAVAVLGLGLSVLTLCWAAFRLLLGGGVI